MHGQRVAIDDSLLCIHPLSWNGGLLMDPTDAVLRSTRARNGHGLRAQLLSPRLVLSTRQSRHSPSRGACARVVRNRSPVRGWRWPCRACAPRYGPSTGRTTSHSTLQHVRALLDASLPKRAQGTPVKGTQSDAGCKTKRVRRGMTNKKYANLTKTSPATAQRDLADLVAKGCLDA
jgi:hypothetical protein